MLICFFVSKLKANLSLTNFTELHRLNTNVSHMPIAIGKLINTDQYS